MGQFGERAVHVWQRQAGEAAEPVGAVSSLHRRARTRAAVSSPVCTPGVLTEVTATSMPASSRNERVLARDQGGGAIPPTGWSPSLVARQKKSGSMWWWMSTVKVTAASLWLEAVLTDHYGYARTCGTWP
jgi:hypothetical protein